MYIETLYQNTRDILSVYIVVYNVYALYYIYSPQSQFDEKFKHLHAWTCYRHSKQLIHDVYVYVNKIICTIMCTPTMMTRTQIQMYASACIHVQCVCVCVGYDVFCGRFRGAGDRRRGSRTYRLGLVRQMVGGVG